MIDMFGAIVTQVVGRVGQCLEGQRVRVGCQLCHSRCVLGQDTSPTLPRVNVYDCWLNSKFICNSNPPAAELMLQIMSQLPCHYSRQAGWQRWVALLLLLHHQICPLYQTSPGKGPKRPVHLSAKLQVTNCHEQSKSFDHFLFQLIITFIMTHRPTLLQRLR